MRTLRAVLLLAFAAASHDLAHRASSLAPEPGEVALEHSLGACDTLAVTAQQTIDDYFESERASSLLRRADLSKDDVFARAALGVRDVMRRLDALPRDDAFWNGTNKRATIHKAGAYASKLVTHDPGDIQAWWCIVGMGLWSCDNAFGSAGFKGLHAIGLLDASCPVRAALEVFVSSGYDPAKLLARLVAELGIEAETRAALGELTRTHERGPWWKSRVLAEMAGGSGAQF